MRGLLWVCPIFHLQILYLANRPSVEECLHRNQGRVSQYRRGRLTLEVGLSTADLRAVSVGWKNDRAPELNVARLHQSHWLG